MQFKPKSRKYSHFIVEGNAKYNFKTAEDEIKSVNGKKEKISIKENGQNTIIIKYRNKNYQAEIVEKNQNRYVVLINGNSYEFAVETPTSQKRKKIITQKTGEIKDFDVKAPMPGKVVDVFVENGDLIKSGETLFTLEAMKMQNEILSEVTGEITEINVSPGENILKNQLVIKVRKQ